ncbi:Permease for cytosine/purine, uracil, thiamine, allantoin [compost metagenome]
MSWLSYNGVMFVGITGITLIDYFVLRREQLDPTSLFATKDSKYAFWGGVNWAAVVISIAATVGYLWLYNPVTVAMSVPFRYLGASIPVVVFSALSYYLAVRLVVAPMRKGSYALATTTFSRPTLNQQSEPDAVAVSL